MGWAAIESGASKFIQSVQPFAATIGTIGSGANDLKKSYSTLRSTLNDATGGLIKLPAASDTGVGKLLNKVIGVGSAANSILKILGLEGVAGEETHVQYSNTNPETGAFKWVEMETTPDSFATPDSVLLFAGKPLYSDNATGEEFVPIGLCQGFNFNVGLTVQAFKELRCEENIIYPGKSQPGNLSMARLCGTHASLTNRLHILPGWNYGTHSKSVKPLFGLLVMFLSPSRANTISVMYFERCAITSANLAVSAGNFQVMDNVSIMFGRCISVGEAVMAETAKNTEKSDDKKSEDKKSEDKKSDDKKSDDKKSETKKEG